MSKSRPTVNATSQRARKTLYPCSVCDKACGVGTILCETGCGLWVHKVCVPMSDEEFVEVSNSNDYFLCPKCIFIPNTDQEFDFEKCLKRYVYRIVINNVNNIIC